MRPCAIAEHLFATCGFAILSRATFPSPMPTSTTASPHLSSLLFHHPFAYAVNTASPQTRIQHLLRSFVHKLFFNSQWPDGPGQGHLRPVAASQLIISDHPSLLSPSYGILVAQGLCSNSYVESRIDHATLYLLQSGRADNSPLLASWNRALHRLQLLQASPK